MRIHELARRAGIFQSADRLIASSITQSNGDSTSVKNRIILVWILLLGILIVAVNFGAVRSQNNAQRTAVPEGSVGQGMRPERMTRFGEVQPLRFSSTVWHSSGGTTEMVEFRSNIAVCTIEDIFGSREAFEIMLGGDESK